MRKLRAIRPAALIAAIALSLTAARAAPVPNPADFAIIEGPGIYTVINNSDDWYIYGLLVGGRLDERSPRPTASLRDLDRDSDDRLGR